MALNRFMTLCLDDDWLWDFWFARDGDEVHLFYLRASRRLLDPDLRHDRATIGHAVSTDLRRWTPLPDALGRGAPGAFDDRATWTGSVQRAGDEWVMAYTGISDADDGTVQRIGFARSADLTTWIRCGPVLEADGRWYEKQGPGVRYESWRDPWLFRHEGRWHLLVTARANHGPSDGRGVVAHAWSDDLATWETGPPLVGPGEFAMLEVPQLVHVGGRWRLLFSTQPGEHSAARLERDGVVAEGGTHVLSSTSPLGPFELDGDAFLVGGTEGRYYAGRLIHHDDAWRFLAWSDRGLDDGFVGALSDPMPVTVRPDGRLAVEIAPLVPGPRS
jgi:beta-fructofuranosidase